MKSVEQLANFFNKWEQRIYGKTPGFTAKGVSSNKVSEVGCQPTNEEKVVA